MALIFNKTKLYKTVNYWSRDILNFDFLKKGLGIVSPTHFVFDFSRKIFFMLYSINWPNSTVWLLLLLEILVNMCIAILCFVGCDAINFEINLIFLIRLCFYMMKSSRQKFNILRMKRAFKLKLKAFFIIFRGLSMAKFFVRLESAPLKQEILSKFLREKCVFLARINLNK